MRGFQTKGLKSKRALGSMLPERPDRETRIDLAMPAAVEVSTMESGYVMPAADISGRDRRPVISIPGPIGRNRPITVSWMPVNRPTIVAVIPRARADENAACEPARPIITVRRASVRIVAIISVSTNRRRSNAGNDRPNTDANTNLCMSTASQCKKQDSQKRDIS
jgi:hypothetical protein